MGVLCRSDAFLAGDLAGDFDWNADLSDIFANLAAFTRRPAAVSFS
jgi:hypothetical protein